jgi:anti-anti-sigma regulatory factor
VIRAAATPGDAAVSGDDRGHALVDLFRVYASLFRWRCSWRAGRPRWWSRLGQRRARDRRRCTGTTRAAVPHLEGDLAAVAPELSDRLQEICARGPELVILRLKRARHLDATVLEVLRRLASDLELRGAELVLCSLPATVVSALARTELGALLGAGRLLPAGERLHEGLERALDLARRRLGPRSDAEIFRCEVGDDGDYEI